ncbi:MAG: hypothetical protein FWB76_04525 [Oscillospiraceae bacterium]|nr:hypothetical protein [Oscillospiraceae bacterium]
MRADNNILMVKLFSGEHGANGDEQFNLTPNPVDGNYYGVILKRGQQDPILLQRIDSRATVRTLQLNNVLVIYCAAVVDDTCIVAIAENTTVFRQPQSDPSILNERAHSGTGVKIPYHTITTPNDMHVLKVPIRLDFPRKPNANWAFFNAHRAIARTLANRDLRTHIIEQADNYLASL